MVKFISNECMIFAYCLLCLPPLPGQTTTSPFSISLLPFTQAQVTVAILLNCFVGAITAAEEEAAEAATAGMKSKEMLRCVAE
jgi:hypothetical protein